MFLLKWKYPGYFIMHKEVTGLAGKVIALVIGISLFFSKMFSSFWPLETQCFQLTESQPWILDMYLEQKWAQLGAEDHSYPHCVLLQRLYCATQQQFDLTVAHHSGPRWSVPQLCPAPQILFSAEELARHWDGPFFSSPGASVLRRVKLHRVWKEEQNSW